VQKVGRIVLVFSFLLQTWSFGGGIECKLGPQGTRIFEWMSAKRCLRKGGIVMQDGWKRPNPLNSAPKLNPGLILEGKLPTDLKDSDLHRCWLKAPMDYGVHAVASRFLCNRLGGKILANLDTGRASLRALRRQKRPLEERLIGDRIECRIKDPNEFVFGDLTRLMCNSLHGFVMNDLGLKLNPKFEGSIYRSRFIQPDHMLGIKGCSLLQNGELLEGEMTLHLCRTLRGKITAYSEPELPQKTRKGSPPQDYFSIQRKKWNQYNEGEISFDDLLDDGEPQF
jgi:hypothetical protein